MQSKRIFIELCFSLSLSYMLSLSIFKNNPMLLLEVFDCVV